MSEHECGFVTKDGRLKVLRAGAVRFKGVNERTGNEEDYSTVMVASFAITIGEELKRYLQLVRAHGMSRTGRIARALGPLRGPSSDELQASVGPNDVLITVRTGPRSRPTVDAFPPAYTHEEMLEVAEAMVKAGKEDD